MGVGVEVGLGWGGARGPLLAHGLLLNAHEMWCCDYPKYIIHSLVAYDICITCQPISRDRSQYYINTINSLWPSCHITPEIFINIIWTNAGLLPLRSLKTNSSKISNYKHIFLIKCIQNVVWKMVAILFRPGRAYEMETHLLSIYASTRK